MAKSANEIKKTRSIKVSQNQYDIIKKKADEKHMSFSEYVVDCAVHGNDSLTPHVAVKVQSIVNMVNDLAERLDYDEYETKERLFQQSKELDELFHYDTPLDTYVKITQGIEKIRLEADSLWVSLR